MAYVPGFEYDVFISYASDEFDDRLDALIQELGAYLRRELGRDFSKDSIFFDREALNLTPVQWRQKLEKSAKSVAILVPIISPSYASSDYCAQEWNWFCEQPPLNWKAGTESVYRVCPVPWRAVHEDLLQQVPREIRFAQQQPVAGAEELGAKLANGLRLMRRSRQTVYVGETEHESRARVRAELSRMGFRVMPEAAMAYGDSQRVRTLLGEAKLAVHFAGDQYNQRSIDAINWSRRDCRYATVVYQHPGVDLSPEESVSLQWIEDEIGSARTGDSRTYDRISGRTFEQLLEVIKDRLENALPVPATRIGIACEEADRPVAESIIPAIEGYTGFSVTCHGLSLLDFKKSRGILFYWGIAKGERLRQARLVAKGLVNAFFLAPPPKPEPLDVGITDCRVLRQRSADFQVEDVRSFLEDLGWTG